MQLPRKNKTKFPFPVRISSDIVLLVIFILSVTFILLFQLLWANSTELFRGGAKLSEVLVNVLISYVAAYIFYVVQIFIPKRVERNALKEFIARDIAWVADYISLFAEALTDRKISQERFRANDLCLEEISDALTLVRLGNLSSISSIYQKSIGARSNELLKDIYRASEKALRFPQHLEPELVSVLVKIQYSGMGDGFPPLNENADVCPIDCDKHILEFHKYYIKLNNILVNHYADTAAGRSRISLVSAA